MPKTSQEVAPRDDGAPTESRKAWNAPAWRIVQVKRSQAAHDTHADGPDFTS